MSIALHIGKAAFQWLVNEIAQNYLLQDQKSKIQTDVQLVPQVASEYHLVGLLEDSIFCVVYAERVTYMSKNIPSGPLNL